MARRHTVFLTALMLAALTFQVAVAAEDPAKQADVTQKVTDQLKNNKLAFTVSNDLFADPSPGDFKSLRIDYMDGDKAHTRMFAENQDVSITPTQGQTLTVKKAVYGVLEAPLLVGPLDATDKVAAAVKDNALSISVDNDTLGGDPAVNIIKQLKVTYTIDGMPQTITANEGDTLTIPKPDGGKKLAITQAIYADPAAMPPSAATAPTTAP